MYSIQYQQASYFNPRPPWGGRQIVQGYRFPNIVISIHALRGEGDHGFVKLYNKQKISIHALRGEGDARR